MFNNKKDNEADFCESYKSQILGSNSNEKKSSFFNTLLKLLTILILLVIIIGVSFYGYNYFMNNKSIKSMTPPPVSVQISDDDLVVEDEDPVEEEEIIEEENISVSIMPMLKEEESDIDQIAKSEVEEENQTTTKEASNLEVPTSAPEAKYLEDLADLSKEIDKERNK